jgi:hypothetical protein
MRLSHRCGNRALCLGETPQTFDLFTKKSTHKKTAQYKKLLRADHL